MKNRAFLNPMKRSELIAGWIYLPIHIFILPILISVAMVTLFPLMGISLDDPHLNFAYYAVSFIYILAFMFRYLKNSFSNFIDNFSRSLAAIGLGFLMYYIANIAVNMLILYFTDNLTNPNTEIINTSTKLNVNMMAAVGVLLAPHCGGESVSRRGFREHQKKDQDMGVYSLRTAFRGVSPLGFLSGRL